MINLTACCQDWQRSNAGLFKFSVTFPIKRYLYDEGILDNGGIAVKNKIFHTQGLVLTHKA